MPAMPRLRTLLFGQPTTHTPAMDAGLLLLRLFAGLALAFGHGMDKLPPTERFVAGVAEMGYPAPELFAYAAGLSEFVGGLLVALGLFTRPAAFLAFFTVANAAVLRHAGDPFGEREKALLFAATMLLFVLGGPGRFSLDALIRGRRR
ncbi:MAG TPA: DoxX family protein [Longimicrobium sp.]|nr:DoxX family protein [Longimicrobium sp.]